ncbi:MAG: hypothetical protein ACXWP4_06415 [Polyangiales bacterium]
MSLLPRATFTTLAIFATLSCAPKQAAPPPAPPPRLGKIEVPEDLVAEMMIRDPLSTAESVAKALGVEGMDDPKQLAKGDPSLQDLVNIVDFHGAMAVAVLGDAKSPDGWHVVMAAKAKDVNLAKQTLAARAKEGKLKANDTPSIRGVVYTDPQKPKNGGFAIIGEAIVLSDVVPGIEAAGRWIAREATDGTPPHDLTLRVPLSRLAPELRTQAKSWWDKEKQTDPDAPAIAPFMEQVVRGLGDLGDLTLSLDLEREDAVMEAHLEVTGELSQLLAAFPSTTPRSLLTLPKGNGAFVLRVPDSLSDLFKKGIADEAKKSGGGRSLELVSAFGKALGHEVAFVYTERSKKAKGNEAFPEVLVRIELANPASAKAIVKEAWAELTKKPSRKVVIKPYAKLGAEGESVSWVDGNEKLEMKWAIKGPQLFLDVAFEGKTTLIDAAVDPAAKQLLQNDPRAKTFAEKLPKLGLAAIYYAETSKAPSLAELGAVPHLSGVRWMWLTAAKDGFATAWNIPLGDLGPFSPAPPTKTASLP